MKAVRVFYRKADNSIVWYHALEGSGKFPNSIEDDLTKLPQQRVGTILLGGYPNLYAGIEENDPSKADAFLASDNNQIIDDVLVTGTPRPVVTPPPPRDLAAELDKLKAKLKQAGIAV